MRAITFLVVIIVAAVSALLAAMGGFAVAIAFWIAAVAVIASTKVTRRGPWRDA